MSAELSLLCYSSRPAFLPWLMRQIATQKEALGPRVEVILVQVEAPVPVTCNRLLAAARAPYLAWMADDDWHHPDKYRMLLDTAQRESCAWAGWSHGWFVRAHDPTHCEPYQGPFPPPASSVYRTELAKACVWDESRQVATDTRWAKQLLKHVTPHVLPVKFPHSVWICHGHNMSRRDYKFAQAMPEAFTETSMFADVQNLHEHLSIRWSSE